MINILFFGPVAELVGQKQLDIPFCEGLTVQQVREQLSSQYPAAFEIVCFVAVNGEHVLDMNMSLREGSEVVFMSKFSGG